MYMNLIYIVSEENRSFVLQLSTHIFALRLLHTQSVVHPTSAAQKMQPSVCNECIVEIHAMYTSALNSVIFSHLIINNCYDSRSLSHSLYLSHFSCKWIYIQDFLLIFCLFVCLRLHRCDMTIQIKAFRYRHHKYTFLSVEKTRYLKYV